MPPSLDPPPPPPPSISPSSDEKYRTLVIDSNTIIKNAALQLHNKASSFYTTQGVLDEIRDSKARHHLDTLPFEIKIKEPSREACRAIVDFSRKTGDYHCLSSVDLKVLALTYDLEVEGCGNANHLRKEPKRALIGKMTPLGNAPTEESSSDPASASTDAVPQNDIIDAADVDYDDDDDDSVGDETTTTTATAPPVSRRPSNPSPAVSWASLVNPAATAVTPTPPDRIADTVVNQTFGKMSLNDNNNNNNKTTNDTLAVVDLGGQFDDASESSNDVDDDDGMKYAASDADVSDEECDVYILDPHEVKERKRAQAAAAGEPTTTTAVWSTPDEFPTLADAALIPYEGSDDEQQQQQQQPAAAAREAKTPQQQQRRYNSFSKYSHIVTPQGVGNIKQKSSDLKREEEKERLLAAIHEKEAAESTTNTKTTTTNNNSRIMGGQSLAGQHHDVDDDDTGWITSTTLAKAKITGFSNFSLPTTTTTTKPSPSSSSSSHPPSLRSALITSDYAMQNVALQLSLPLLAPDGTRRITRTKLWVRRCSACFTIYRNNSESRLFCERCGNGNTLERIAASVDGTTGRLRLHLSKKKRRVKLKGSKYSLPKPGKGNRFEGGLLLREDQLMMGAWCQKVKKGNKKSQECLFGSDINDAVGLGDVTKRSDIMVGFGRRNPNASKFGRERRGKKTKGDKRDKACGLRRY